MGLICADYDVGYALARCPWAALGGVHARPGPWRKRGRKALSNKMLLRLTYIVECLAGLGKGRV